MYTGPQTKRDFLIQKHEAAHEVAAYLVFGPDAVRGVTCKPGDGYLGCANVDLPMDPARDPALAAADCATVILVGVYFYADDSRGEKSDVAMVYRCAEVAYNRLARPGSDPEDWVADWKHQVWRRVYELADSTVFIRCMNAIERALDRWPTLTGDQVREILSKEVKSNNARNPEA